MEYKVPAYTGIMLHIEIQESKEDMANKGFTDHYAKHTAHVLRLSQRCCMVRAISAFTSVKTPCAMLEHGMYYTGLLKTAHQGFPKSYLNTLVKNIVGQPSLLKQQLQLEGRNARYMDMPGMNQEQQMYLRSVS